MNEHEHEARGRRAADPSTPPEVLTALARDDDPFVRWAVVRNPSTPPEVLAALAKVAGAALQE